MRILIIMRKNKMKFKIIKMAMLKIMMFLNLGEVRKQGNLKILEIISLFIL